MIRLLAASLGATVMLWAGASSAVVIFQDNFNGANDNGVGNGWAQIEETANGVEQINNVLRLRGRDGGAIDAQAAQLAISTLGFGTITLDFDWAALVDSEAEDLLLVDWRVATGSWTTLAGINLFSTGLGGDGTFSHVQLALTGADNLSNIQFRFRIDVDKNCCTGASASRENEGALIDNVLLQGIALPPTQIPEPATLALIGVGLAAIGFRFRKRANRSTNLRSLLAGRN